jgi:hypothetical protein
MGRLINRLRNSFTYGVGKALAWIYGRLLDRPILMRDRRGFLFEVSYGVRGHVEVPAGGREMSPLPCRD